MLSKADDYPVHQRPEPIATAGSDRNFYDRYFFNAQSPDGSRFLAVALGVYPQLDVMDAAFAWMEDGVQRSVFASRKLGGERMDTAVGPITVEVVEPLRQLDVRLEETGGLEAEIRFTGRHAPVEEPRFVRRIGPRLLMDATRMTQNVALAGRLVVNGHGINLDGWLGTRDRSWGIRPVGAPDAQPPAVAPQFFWLWAPLNFERHCLYFHRNDDADGSAWNRSMLLVDLASGATERLVETETALRWQPGTRWLAEATVRGRTRAGGAVEVALSPRGRFHMHGLGYGHPRFAHGLWRGVLDVAHDRFETSSADPASPAHAHIQALVQAELRLPDGSSHAGRGVLEQLVIGAHRPSGFRELFDLA